jgi:hypothetical protein
MRTSESKIIDGYKELINTLSPAMKDRLLFEISSKGKSLDTDSFRKAFGAWDSTESAEVIISAIKESRKFSRKTETF